MGSGRRVGLSRVEVSRRRAVLLPVSVAAVGGLGLAGCTSSGAPAAGQSDVVAATASPSSDSVPTATSTPGVGTTAVPTTSTAAAPPVRLTSSLGTRAKDIAFSDPLELALHGGIGSDHLQDVTLVGGSGSVAGRFDTARRSWTTDALAPAARYTLTAVVASAAGEKSWKRTFTTTAPDRTLSASVFPSASQTVGVGMPLVVSFNHSVTDKAAVERALRVTTTAPVVGAWHWFTDDAVTFRPKSYWPANTRVRVTAALAGVDAGDGVWGVTDSDPVAFSTGDSVVNKVDLASDTMHVVVNGVVARTVPVTGGQAGMNTRTGISVISQKYADIEMDSESVGYAKGSANYYDLMVHWAMRITNSGEFLHAAPWSVYAQGRENVSHGCVGMSTADAYWLYRHTNIGDVVEVTGTDRPLEQGNGWTDWNVSWKDWTAGSALKATVRT